MKTSTLIFVLFAISFLGYSQNSHDEIESFFADKTIQNLETAVALTESEYHNQNLLDFVDARYQLFHQEIEAQIESGVTLTLAQVDSAWDILVQEIITDKNSIPNNGATPPAAKLEDGPCENMDFETGDFTGWTLTRGDVTGATPYSYAAEFVTAPGPYHTIFGGGVDPVTGIPCVNPLGGGFSARLGNGTGTGARAARLRQTFMVDATNYLFTYSFAVIFESPAGHTLNQLPYFTVRVFDSLGNNINCGEYSVIADATTAADYLTTNFGGTTVLYQDWQTVFTNLIGYIGQNVTVEFTAGDCSLTGHFGYAYVDASCSVDQLTASNDIICAGDSSLLSAPLGADSYLWSNGATTQTTMVYTGGTYSCELIPFQGGACSITLDITIDENPSPTAIFVPNTATVCVNESVNFVDGSTIPAPGVITGYQWDFGDGVITPVSTGAIVAVPNTTGTYLNPDHTYTAAGVYNAQLYVISADGCEDSITQVIVVNALPVVTAGVDQTVCEGTAVTLSGAGATTYAWDNGVTDGVAFVPAVGTLIYTVIGTDGNGCSATDQVQVIVNPNPIVNAGVDQTVCDGTGVTLSGSGATTYAWDNGITDGVGFVPAVGTIVYTVTGTDGNGCFATDQVQVTVNPNPIVNAGIDQTVCEGTTVTLSGSGATTYAWDNGIADGVGFVPAVGTLVYTVIGTDGNACFATDQVQVTVNPNPIVNAGNDQTVCEGTAVTLSGSGATTYAWDNGVTDGVGFVPAVGTLIYTVTGTDGNGCFATDQVQVTVNPNPIVNAGIDQTVCEGTVVTLSGSGAVTYSWDNGVADGMGFVPAVGTVVYTVIGTDGNVCTATDQVQVTVNPNPIVNAGVDQTVCEGTMVTLSGSGATTYTWDNGITDGVGFVPAVGTVIYTVIGTDGNGCFAADQAQVTVNPNPIVNAGVDQTVCEGTMVTLLGSGATSYAWDNGITDGVGFVPAVGSLVYTVIGTDGNGCSATDQVQVTVNPNPIVNAGVDQTVCEGTTVTLSGSGATSYTWDNGVTDGVGFVPSVGTIMYTVIGTDGNGCFAIDQAQVTVNPNPVVSAGPDQVVCEGTAVTLSGSGATSYAWDNGVTNGVPFVPAVGTHLFTVTGSYATSCFAIDAVQVIVNPNPIVNAGPDQTVCDGTEVTFNATGSANLVWSSGVINNQPFTAPIGTTVYVVYDTLATGCFAQDDLTLIVHPNPVVTANSAEICEGESVVLSGSGAVSYTWSNGVINNQAFEPSLSTTYTVIGYDANGCSGTAQSNVIVHENPTVSFTWLNKDLTMTNPGTDFLNHSEGAVSYSWDFGDWTSSNEFEPYHEFPDHEGGEYLVTLEGVSEFGCVANYSQYIQVVQDYSFFAPNAFTPDNNGMNEIFNPVMFGFDPYEYTLLIFNRWGQILFESHNMEVGWDGTLKNQSDAVQDGVYTWKVTARVLNSSEIKAYTGHVSILK